MLFNSRKAEGEEELIARTVGESADRNAWGRSAASALPSIHLRLFVVDVEPLERLVGQSLEELTGSVE